MAGVLDFLDFQARAVERAAGTDIADILLREAPLGGREALERGANDEGIIATLFGIPVGFQFGTAAGMTGFSALAVDILTDPLTYLGGLGALNKLGRAGKAAATSWRAAGRLGLLAEEVGKLPKMSAAAKAAVIAEHVKTTARLETRSLSTLQKALRGVTDPKDAMTRLKSIREEVRRMVQFSGSKDFADAASKMGEPAARRAEQMLRQTRGEFPGVKTISDAITSLHKGGVEGVNDFLAKQVGIRETLSTMGADLVKAGNYGEFRKVAKQIRKLEPSARFNILFGKDNLRNIEALFEIGDAERLAKGIGGPGARQAALRSQTSLEQRTLLNFRIPFTNIEKPLLVGQPVLSKGLALAEKTGLRSMLAGGKEALIPGGRAAAEAVRRVQGAPVGGARPDSVADIMDVTRSLINADQVPNNVRDFKGFHEVYGADVQAGRALGSVLEAEVNHVAMGGFDKFARRHLQMGLKGGEAGLEKQRLDYLTKSVTILETPDDVLTKATQDGQPFTSRSLTEKAKAAGYTDEHIELAEALRIEFDRIGKDLEAKKLIPGMEHNYFPRIVKHVKKQAEWDQFNIRFQQSNWAGRRYRSGYSRVLPSVKQLRVLEKKGIIELEKDPAKVLRAYVEGATETAAKARLMDRVTSSRAPFEIAAGAKEPIEEWVPIMTSWNRIPKEAKHLYKRVTDDPGIIAFAQRVGIKDSTQIAIHKDSVIAMQRLLQPVAKAGEAAPLSEKLFQKGMVLNALAKRSLLSFSAFHYTTLFESGVASLGWDFLRNPAKAIRQGQRDFFEATDVMQMAIRSGLQVGPMADAEVGVISKHVRLAEKGIPAISPATRMLTEAVGTWDRPLWDYYHNAMKMFAFHELYQRGLAKFGTKNTARVARATAEHVNNAFGGQVWENMLIGKTGQRLARLILLAPDWTISNLKIAGDVFANKFKKWEWFQKTGRWAGFTIGPEDIARADIRAFFARRYALHVGMISAAMANMANFAFTGHFMWDNAKGHQAQIQLPFDDDEGRGLFLSPGKQFKEPFEALASTPNLGIDFFLKRKGSRALQTAVGLIAGRDLHTGAPIVLPEDGPGMQVARHLGFVIGGNLPIPLQQTRREGTGVGGAVLGSMGFPVKRERRDLNPAPIPEVFNNVFSDTKFRRDYERNTSQAIAPTAGMFSGLR